MTGKEYYKTPSQEIFDDIKENAIKIWQTYDDTYGYAREKISRVKNLENISDNAWSIVAMFDWMNVYKLLRMVKPKTAEMIEKARSNK